MWCVSKGSKASAESVFKRIFGIGCERLHSKGRKKSQRFFSGLAKFQSRSNEKDLTNVMCLQILQGVSEWTDISKLALRGRSIINLLELWCIVASGGLEICESSNSFQKNYIFLWSLIIFLSEAVEASQCHFFENCLMKLKSPHLLKPLGNILQ